MRVVVTGIGSPLARKAALLLRAKGYEVMGFSRRKASPIEGVELKIGDIRCRPSVFQLLKGAGAVIHCAALSSPWGKEEDFYQINVRGTEHLLDAALHGQMRFVHVSTPSLYYNFEPRWNITENSVFSERFANGYVKSKYLAEKGVERAVKQGLHAVTIRPRAIFGPGDQVLLPRLMKALERGGIPRFCKGDVWVDVSYVDNVAESLVLALEKGKQGMHYNITNDEPWELFALFSELIHLIGQEMKVRRIPYSLAQWIARGSEFLSRFTGKEPLFTPYTVGVLTHSQTFDIQRAKQELGYSPQVSVKEGMKRYAAWWCETQNL